MQLNSLPINEFTNEKTIFDEPQVQIIVSKNMITVTMHSLPRYNIINSYSLFFALKYT